MNYLLASIKNILNVSTDVLVNAILVLNLSMIVSHKE